MPDYDEFAEIPMDGGVVWREEDQQPKEIPDGEYIFTVCELKTEWKERSEKAPRHMVQKFRLKLSNADGDVGYLWDNVPMYMKFMWKYTKLAKAIGHTPKDSDKVTLRWSEIVGAEGRCKVERKPQKKDPTKTFAAIDYLLPADENDPALKELDF